MKQKLVISEPALSDLFDINDYYLLEASDKTAAKIIDDLQQAIEGLSKLPDRGSYPKELSVLGIRQYRQLIHKRYRIIYERTAKYIIVHAVLDGRRDIQSLLTRRLLIE
ncbi:MAG: type II toxin-antitoxin system RelE/ParE family toxin [Proteobacteria bacterium]|nr:type II toxin-antitoxin system RelE/ParE family toxin [Pseudomonadota bacterium]